MKIYICSILILCSFFAKAHEYRLQTRRITVEDGLPNDFVYQTMQDRDGFMWVATNYGYCRFDGYEAEIYYEQVDKKRKSARYNSVTAILQDQAGKLWIIYNHFAAWQTASNTMMIEIFDPLSKEALSFDQYFGQKAPFAMTEVIFVSGINEHKLWLVTTQGEVYTYDGSFCKIATLPTCLLHNNPLYILVASSKETLWLLDYNSLILYEVQDNGTLQTTLMPADHFDREDIRNTPRVDEKGILWMAMHTSNEIWSKAPNQPIHKQQFHINKELESFTTNVNSAEFLLKDQAARYWYICNDHIFVFDRHLKLLAHSVSDQKKRAPFGTIYNAMIDKLGQLWLSSNVGITLVSLYTSPFHNYLTNKGIQDVRGIIVDEQNNIYVSQSGLFEVSKGERLLSKYRVSLTGNIKDGNYIIASQYSNKLYKIDLNTGAESYIPTDKGLINKNAFASVLYKSKKTGRIWVGGYLLLGYLNESKDSVLLFTKYNNFSSLKNCSIQFFFENEEGIWLCTDKGLYLLDEQKGVLQYFNDIFPYANLMYLHQDKASIFWIATRGGGLLRWDRRTDQFTQFTQKEGLSNDVIYAVYEDDYGYLWLPSNYGLMRMNKATYEVSTYLPKDGIPHHEFNFTSHFRAPDGRLFFGGLGGVTAFHPKDFLQPVASDAPFHVINFKKLHANTGALQDFTKTLLTNNRIILYPGERSFFLKIALLNYQKSKSNQYAYRIEGLEKDWKFIAGNSLYLGGLPYGNYTLHIKALDVNGVWAKQTLFIPIQVLPPIYLQTWFLIIIFVITLILAYIFFRWRTLRLIKDRQHLAAEVARRTATIEQQAAELQALNEQKSKFFLNIAHDLRTPLTFIITPITHFLQEEPADERVKKFLQSIHRNAYHLLGLVEGILDLSKIDRQALTLQEKPVYLYPLIRLIFSMYESYAKMHHLTYTLHYEADAQLYLLLDKEKFEKIIDLRQVDYQ
ncbi:MAG: two-component regulator propeller domain-containing protein [Saprospiraceae bacterium]